MEKQRNREKRITITKKEIEDRAEIRGNRKGEKMRIARKENRQRWEKKQRGWKEKNDEDGKEDRGNRKQKERKIRITKKEIR